jgi:hypothetical protein|tara:strand:- start:99 stop:572 length:474 start_codon:yes stop_codon:yes gene_type:complete
MNQAKVKEEVSGIYEISLVPSDKIGLIWDQAEKYLKKSASRSNGRTRIEDIFHDLISSKTHLWVIFDTGDLSIVGVQITLFNNYPTGKKMLCLEHTAGKNMQEWVENGIDLIIKFAKDNQCDGIEGIGRHGQWNWVKNKKGWKRPATFYEYNFEEGT